MNAGFDFEDILNDVKLSDYMTKVILTNGMSKMIPHRPKSEYREEVTAKNPDPINSEIIIPTSSGRLVEQPKNEAHMYAKIDSPKSSHKSIQPSDKPDKSFPKNESQKSSHKSDKSFSKKASLISSKKHIKPSAKLMPSKFFEEGKYKFKLSGDYILPTNYLDEPIIQLEEINEKIVFEESSAKEVKTAPIPIDFVLTDKMVNELENQLLQDDDEDLFESSSYLHQKLLRNLEILQIIRKRILLKEKAFNLVPKVMRGDYVVLCQFLLLKGMLFDIYSFQPILYSKENHLNLSNWEEFQKKTGYAKFVSLIITLENRLFLHLDSSLKKAKQGARVIEQSQAIPMIWKYLNDDPYQNPEPVLKALLPMIITRFLTYLGSRTVRKSQKEINKGLLKICMQLILMTYERGIFDVKEPVLDHYERLQKRRGEQDLEVLERVYQDLLG